MKSYRSFPRILSIILISAVSLLVVSGQKSTVAGPSGKMGPDFFSRLKFTDIGKGIKPGKQSINNDEVTLFAAGADIWGRHDEFRFGYKTIKGDFDIILRIKNLSSANKYTKAGLMARESLSDSSRHVYWQVFPDNSARNKNNGGCEFQYRATDGGEMKAVYPDPATAGNLFNVSYPDTWIRLKRTAGYFESYFSNDNKTWNLYTGFELKMPEEIFVGLAVTSHNKDEYTSAGFSLK